MKLLEYESKELFRAHRIPVPPSGGVIRAAASQKKSGEASSLPVASLRTRSVWIPLGLTKSSRAERRSFRASRKTPAKS